MFEFIAILSALVFIYLAKIKSFEGFLVVAVVLFLFLQLIDFVDNADEL